MAKKVNVDYRKICQEHYGYSNEQMFGMDVHHIDGNRDNNHPSNLMLLDPSEHAKIHANDFVKWARKGAKIGNESLRKRLKEKGPTEKEILHRSKLSMLCKNGIHRIPHSEETKQIISENKKDLFKDKTKHPMWGNTTYEVTSPTEEVFIVSGGWKQWCFDRGLNPSNMIKVAKGERKHCKGWKVKIINE